MVRRVHILTACVALLVTSSQAGGFLAPGQSPRVVVRWEDFETTNPVEAYVILRSKGDPVVTMADAITTVTRAETFVSTGTVCTFHMWTDTTVTPNAPYYYRLVCYRAGVYSVVSALSPVRTQGPRPPKPPHNPKAGD